MTSRTCTWMRSRPTTTPTAAATRPSATAPPRRWSPSSPATGTTVEWYRPLPPPAQKTFTWSARDNVNYNETAMLAALDDSAQQSKQLLRNYYLKGLHSYQRGLEQPPFGFLIPAGQGDPARVAQLVARLMAQGIEVHRADADVTLKEGSYPAGTYVVRLDQPYRDYAVDLLTPQDFPKDAGEAYDDVSWELPAHYHLTAVATADPAVRNASLDAAYDAAAARGRRERRGAGASAEGHRPGGTARGPLPPRALQGVDRRARVQRRWHSTTRRLVDSGAAGGPRSGGARHCRPSSALDFVSAAAVPDVARHEAPVPRLGLWVPWADTDTIGWARYSLDQRHIPYVYVRDEDIRAGKLRDKYDVLLYGHVDLELAEQIQGIPKAWGPMPFKKTKRDAEPRHAGRVRRHHRRHRLRGARRAAALRRLAVGCSSRSAAARCWRSKAASCAACAASRAACRAARRAAAAPRPPRRSRQSPAPRARTCA